MVVGMQQAGKPAARSLHGCWTCRVRRKKCDERRSVCTPCASLDLECHGYGHKPAWMDNGARQREKALFFKQIVCEKKAKKGRQRAQTVFIAQSPHDAFGATQADVAANMMDLHSACAMPPTELSFEQMHAQNLAMAAVADPAEWSTAPSSDITTESASPFFGGSNDYSPNSTGLYHSMDAGSGPMSSAFFADTSGPESSNLLGFSDAEVSWGDILTGFDEFLDTAFHKNDVSAGYALPSEATGPQNSVTQQAPVAAAALSAWQPAKDTSEEEVPEEEAEDVIFMHFLDQVFYLQYPYYLSRDGRERGWLFSILRRVKPAYYATLAQSERHFLATVPHINGIANSLARRRAGTTYYELAIHGMRYIMAGVNGRTSLVQSIEALTSLLQLLFLEGFMGGTENWKDLLRAAATLVPALITARQSTTPQKGDDMCSRKQNRHAGLSPELRRACCVMLGSFVSLDIIAAASTRGEHFLDIDHVKELENLGTSVQSMMGCSNTTMALICQISALERWKKDAQAAHKLSVVDLVRRGAKIEDQLRQEMVGITGVSAEAGLSRESSSELPARPTHPAVNRVYVLAGTIYLHSILSGAHPHLPEIKQAVAAVLEALMDLRSSVLLQSLSWPFCVAGCLATEDQYSSFRLLFSATASWDATNGTWTEACRIIKDCWSRRSNSDEDCDWASIMDQDGRHVLLR
ncbi:hypothetical protein ACQRIU_004123 [Beauveria bassiana]